MKYLKEDLYAVLKKIYDNSKIESVVGVEWVNYPIEIFDELAAIILEVELKDKLGK